MNAHPPGCRRPGRSSLALVCVVFAVLSGSACTWSAGSEPGLLPSRAPSAVPLPARPTTPSTPGPDAEDGAEISLPPGSHPTAMAAVYGSLWVTSDKSSTALRINPATNQVTQSVDIGQASCGQPLDANGDLLTMPCPGSTRAVVVDGRTGKIRGTVSDVGGVHAAAGAGSFWIPNRTRTALQRVDPQTLAVQKKLRVPTGMVAFDGTFIWSGSSHPRPPKDTAQLAKIDPRTDRVVARHELPTTAGAAMAYGFGALWIKAPDDDKLVRFDPITERTTRVRVKYSDLLPPTIGQPVGLGDGSLWLPLRDGTVVRLSPHTSRISGRYRAEPRGASGYPLVAFTSLWMADSSLGMLQREPIRTTG